MRARACGRPRGVAVEDGPAGRAGAAEPGRDRPRGEKTASTHVHSNKPTSDSTRLATICGGDLWRRSVAAAEMAGLHLCLDRRAHRLSAGGPLHSAPHERGRRSWRRFTGDAHGCTVAKSFTSMWRGHGATSKSWACDNDGDTQAFAGHLMLTLDSVPPKNTFPHACRTRVQQRSPRAAGELEGWLWAQQPSESIDTQGIGPPSNMPDALALRCAIQRGAAVARRNGRTA